MTGCPRRIAPAGLPPPECPCDGLIPYAVANQRAQSRDRSGPGSGAGSSRVSRRSYLLSQAQVSRFDTMLRGSGMSPASLTLSRYLTRFIQVVRRKPWSAMRRTISRGLGGFLAVGHGAGVVVVDLFGDAAHTIDGQFPVVLAPEGADFSPDFAEGSHDWLLAGFSLTAEARSSQRCAE